MLQFLPDAPETTPEVLVDVSLVPTTRGYRNPYTPVSAGIAALASDSLGGALVYKLDGSTRTLAGTATRLYEIAGGSWSDVSRGALYSIGSAKWRFVQFGDTTLACNKATQLQYSNSGAFADIANSPKAACIETAAYFVMLADCDDTGTGLATGFGNQADRWWCSQIFTPTGTWAPASSTQANTGRLSDTPGAIKGLKRLGNDIVAYKEKALYIARYVGGSETWKFQIVASDVGCATQDAVVSAGAVHFFIGDSDIFQFDGMARPVPIGAGIKEWFFARLNRTYRSAMESLHDAVNSTVYWFYPSGSATTPTSCLAYNYVSKTWGHFEIGLRNALSAVTSSITYDTLGNYFATYDDLTGVGYDSPFWLANTPVLSLIGTDNILYSLTSTTGDSSLTTGWIGGEDQVSTCDRVRPRFRDRPATAQITPRTINQLGDSPTTNPGSDINASTGNFDLIQAGNYHQFSMAFTGSMEIEAIAPRFPGASGQ